MTYEDLAGILEKLNSSFNGDFDTLSFGGSAPGKTIGTSTTGVLPVALVPHLEGAAPAASPVQSFDLSMLYNNTPESYALAQNYPNPFNPTTSIEFTLPEDALATVRVYNMLGQLVATLADVEEFTSGINWVDFDADALSSGVYFYHVVVQDLEDGRQLYQRVRKMVLMK